MTRTDALRRETPVERLAGSPGLVGMIGIKQNRVRLARNIGKAGQEVIELVGVRESNDREGLGFVLREKAVEGLDPVKPADICIRMSGSEHCTF